MSETDLFEGISSFQNAIPIMKKLTSKEEEMVFILNQIRYKPRAIFETLKHIKEKRFNKEDQTVYFEELDKRIVGISEQSYDKLLQYVHNIVENNQILPDLSFSAKLNQLFQKSFNTQLLEYNNIFKESSECQEKIMNLFPSVIYQGIYIPDCDLSGNMDLLAIFILIEEFLYLSKESQESTRQEEQITPAFDVFGDGSSPQQVSFLNSIFNTVVIYISERKDSIVGASLYIMLLSDVLEVVEQSVIPPQSNRLENSEASNKKKPMWQVQTANDMRKTGYSELKSTRSVLPLKYSQVSDTNKPDFTRDIVRNFIKKIDSNLDDKIDAKDLISLTRKKNLIYSDEVFKN